MLPELVSGLVLVAVTVTVHAVGLGLLLKRLQAARRLPLTALWPLIGRLVFFAWGLILLHFVEIVLWAAFYRWQRCLPDFESACYFSGVTYATVGYGDVVLAPEWRMLGPVEGLTGGLMIGLSTGFFFAVLSGMMRAARDSE
jgi:hypothetical protein